MAFRSRVHSRARRRKARACKATSPASSMPRLQAAWAAAVSSPSIRLRSSIAASAPEEARSAQRRAACS